MPSREDLVDAKARLEKDLNKKGVKLEFSVFHPWPGGPFSRNVLAQRINQRNNNFKIEGILANGNKVRIKINPLVNSECSFEEFIGNLSVPALE